MVLYINPNQYYWYRTIVLLTNIIGSGCVWVNIRSLCVNKVDICFSLTTIFLENLEVLR